MGRVLHLGVAFLVAAGAVVLGGLVSLPVVIGLALVGPVAVFAGTVVAGEVGIAVIGVAFSRTGDAGDVFPDWSLPTAGGLGLAAAATALLVGVNRAAFGVAATVGIDPVSAISPPAGLATWTTLLAVAPLFVLVVGPAEEYLFRGLLQRYIAQTFSLRGAVGWSSVLFVLVHVPAVVQVSPSALLVAAPVQFVVSVGLGWLYERTDTLVGPALTHGFYDVAVFWFLLVELGL